MSSPVRAAGIVIFRRRPPPPASTSTVEYLLMQTSYGQHHWTPPKGHVDPGESEWDAAARETREESGLEVGRDLKLVEDFKVVNEYRCSTPSRGEHDKRVTYWLAELAKADAKVKMSEEHQVWRKSCLNSHLALIDLNFFYSRTSSGFL